MPASEMCFFVLMLIMLCLAACRQEKEEEEQFLQNLVRFVRLQQFWVQKFCSKNYACIASEAIPKHIQVHFIRKKKKVKVLLKYFAE